MKKFIAPRGEKGAPELRTVLASIASSASKAGGFIERKLAGWKPEQQAELATELWNGTEPVFTELMEAFHCAMENLQNLAGENHEAQHLVEKIPSLKRESENTRYVLWALKIASREADEWLASHPGEKAFWLD